MKTASSVELVRKTVTFDRIIVVGLVPLEPSSMAGDLHSTSVRDELQEFLA